MAFRSITLDCSGIRRPNLSIIDQLARLRLQAWRHGCELLLQNAGEALVGLIELCGLSEVLGVEPRRKPEEREKPGRIKEEGDLGDASL